MNTAKALRYPLRYSNLWTSRPKAFFANRLSKIRAASDAGEWRYVDSSRNPADLCSRGIAASDASKWAFFHNGPQFLRQDPSLWPVMTVSRNPRGPSASRCAVAALEASTSGLPNGGLGTDAPGCGYASVAGSLGGWFAKLRRVVFLKKVVDTWRSYRRLRTDGWVARAAGPLKLSLSR